MGLEDTEIDYNDMDTLKSCDLPKKYKHKLPNTILNNKSPSTIDPHQKQACVSPWIKDTYLSLSRIFQRKW